MSVDIGVIEHFLSPPLVACQLQFRFTLGAGAPPHVDFNPNIFGFAWEAVAWPPGYGSVELAGQRRFFNTLFRWTTIPATLTSITGGKQLHSDLVDEKMAEGLRIFPSNPNHQLALEVMPGVVVDFYSVMLL